LIRFCVYTFIIIASSFLTDESGFLHPASSSSWGDSGIDGGFANGGDCGGGGGASNISSLESNGLKKG